MLLLCCDIIIVVFDDYIAWVICLTLLIEAALTPVQIYQIVHLAVKQTSTLKFTAYHSKCNIAYYCKNRHYCPARQLQHSENTQVSETTHAM